MNSIDAQLRKIIEDLNALDPNEVEEGAREAFITGINQAIIDVEDAAESAGIALQ